jgi:prophage antirepressor-like protein
MTDQPIQNFTFEDGKILAALNQNGEPWFIASHVCKALDIVNTSQALSRLDDDEKGICETYTLGGAQQVATVNESGLYSLILRSNKPSAQRLRKWVTSVVLPSIRKHGGYINGMEELSQEAQVPTLALVQEQARQVGLCVAEEKEARSDAFRLLSRGRRKRKPRLLRSESL